MTSKIPGALSADTVPDTVTISFGNVVINVIPPTPRELKKRIAESNVLLGKIRAAIIQPGITLQTHPAIPLYSADEANPSLIIRHVGKSITRGRFNAQGRFIEVK